MRELKKNIFSKVFDLQNSSRTNFYKNILFSKAAKEVWSSSLTTLPSDINKNEFDKSSVLERFDHQLKSSGLNTSYTYNSPGLYDVCVTVITASGCESALTSPGIVEVYPVPTAGFSANPWVATDLNPVITFQDESSGALNFEWTFGDGENAIGLESDILSTTNTSGTIGMPVHFYNTPGEYTVTQTITNQYGCTDVVSYVVIVNPDQTLFVPNTFTPDNNGLNETFQISGGNLKEMECLKNCLSFLK